MEAIILAGGMGTRLKSIVSELPKPMAPIDDKPFLWYVLEYLFNQKVNKIVLSVGYMHEKIVNYFGNRYKNIPIVYSVEDQPLGTGGAIKKAMDYTTERYVCVLNGDTFFNIDLMKLRETHVSTEADLTLALKPMTSFDRYGTVSTLNGQVTGFFEKGYKESGNINGGIYLIKKDILGKTGLQGNFSFETDFMEKYVDRLKFSFCIFDNYFLDIGIPEDYIKAKKELLQQI